MRAWQGIVHDPQEAGTECKALTGPAQGYTILTSDAVFCCNSCCSTQALICPACHPQEAAHGEMVRVVQAEHARQTAKLRQEVAAGALQLANKYERRVRRLAEDADARRQQEAQEIQERCSAHTQASTMAAHAHATTPAPRCPAVLHRSAIACMVCL